MLGLLAAAVPGGARTDTLPRDGAAAAVAAPLPSATFSGPARVVDTASVMVAGRLLALDGVEGAGGVHAEALQRYIDGHGGSLACHAASAGRFTCLLPNGTDIAMAALVNGSAIAAPGAEAAYVQQQAAARAAQRGLWPSRGSALTPLPAGNTAPALAASTNPERVEQLAFGDWSYFRSLHGREEAKACGLETAWRGGTARLSVLAIGQAGRTRFAFAVRDDGWDLPDRFAGTGSLTIDGRSWPMRFARSDGLPPTVLSGDMATDDVQRALASLAAGSFAYLTTPAGRTSALSSAGAGGAVRAFAACLPWLVPKT